MELSKDEIVTALLILATYPLDDMDITGDHNAHLALALIHKVKAHAVIKGEIITIPEIVLTIRSE